MANCTPNQSHSGNGYITGFGTSTFNKLGMQFTPSITAKLCNFRIQMAKVGSPVDLATLRIYSVDGSGYPNTLLATSDNNVGGGSLNEVFTVDDIDFVFANGPILTNGTKYVAVLSRSGSLDDSNYFAIYTDAHTYTGGYQIEFNGSSWSTNTGYDWAFIQSSDTDSTTTSTSTTSTSTSTTTSTSTSTSTTTSVTTSTSTSTSSTSSSTSTTTTLSIDSRLVHFLDTPVSVSLTVDNTYHEYDVSSYIPAGASAVFGIIRNPTAELWNQEFALRPKGATWDLTGFMVTITTTSWVQFVVGVDGNRKFEAKFKDLYTGYWELIIFGYFNNQLVLLNEPVEYTPGSNSTWTDVNISSNLNPGDSAIAGLWSWIQLGDYGINNTQGEGTEIGAILSDVDADAHARFAGSTQWVVGINNSNLTKFYDSNVTWVKLYLLGYVKRGIDFNSTRVWLDQGNPAGTFADLLPLSNLDAYGAIIDTTIAGQNISTADWLRPKGASTDYYAYVGKSFLITQVDGNAVAEHKGFDYRSRAYEHGLLLNIPVTTTSTSTTTSTTTSTSTTTTSTSTSTTTSTISLTSSSTSTSTTLDYIPRISLITNQI